eukprot:2597460-Heterocapsa_arctica.AAC.1
MHVKQGWWHSEFNRFRYDIELMLNEEGDELPVKEPNLIHVSFAELSREVGLRSPEENELVDPRLESMLPGW